jgi:hypothetical protein
MPAEPIIRSFSSFDEACAAREALVGAGVPREHAQVRVLDDEAGPVEGNFLVGNGRTAHGGFRAAVMTEPEVSYDDNFRNVVRRGAYLLIVEGAADRTDADAIGAVLAGFDAVSPPAGS